MARNNHFPLRKGSELIRQPHASARHEMEHLVEYDSVAMLWKCGGKLPPI